MGNVHHSALALRVEEACLNGWPSLREVVFQGWLLRFADGYTRRSNSVNPLWGDHSDLTERIRYCETLYTAQGLPTVFRIPSWVNPDLSDALDECGYGPVEDETRVLYMDLNHQEFSASGGVHLQEATPTGSWLQTLSDLQGQSEHSRITHQRILEALCIPAVFAGARTDDGELAALAFGAVYNSIVCVNSVITDPSFQRRGLARSVLSAVLTWARDSTGATGACVPVVASNLPAVALYERLGFRHEVHRYHYRRRTSAA
jgi:GNAT superfamily N-acetyltransferase